MAEFLGYSYLLSVRDIEHSLRFYRETLGFELERREARQDGAENVRLRSGAASILLTPATPPSERQLPEYLAERLRTSGMSWDEADLYRSSSLHFLLSDIDAFFERVRPVVEVVTPLTQREDSRRMFSIRDPDGRELVFAEPLED